MPPLSAYDLLMSLGYGVRVVLPQSTLHWGPVSPATMAVMVWSPLLFTLSVLLGTHGANMRIGADYNISIYCGC